MSSFDKIKEQLKDKAFVEGLLKNKSPEEAKAYLAEHGVEMSLDEVKELGAKLYALAKGEAELSESELADAAGGIMGDPDMSDYSALAEFFEPVIEWFRSW